MERGVLQQSNG